MREFASGLLLLTGALFCLITGIGMLRTKDTYAKLHIGTKCLTVGASLVLLGAGLRLPTGLGTLKVVLMVILLWITNPLATNALARGHFLNSRLEE
ncbi:MAG: monovalent cation/H(+) antiporter subunit G [Bacillota bacterium]